MTWPFSCKACGSRDIQAGIDEIHCLVCNRLTDKDGNLVPLEVQHSNEELK